MAAHLFPSSECLAMMVCSSSGEKGSFLREGSSWLNQRKRQLFPFLPVDRFCGWKGWKEERVGGCVCVGG